MALFWVHQWVALPVIYEENGMGDIPQIPSNPGQGTLTSGGLNSTKAALLYLPIRLTCDGHRRQSSRYTSIFPTDGDTSLVSTQYGTNLARSFTLWNG